MELAAVALDMYECTCGGDCELSLFCMSVSQRGC